MKILNILSRRHVLLGLGGAAVAGAAQAKGLGNAGLLAGSFNAGANSLQTAGYAEWTTHVGSAFTIDSGHVLKLVNVQAYDRAGARPAEVRKTGFVASFDIVRGDELPEGRHVVAHPNGDGRFEIYLAKAGAGKPLGMLADYN